MISTHAPLARCDEDFIARKSCFHISTHAPLARCDLYGNFLAICIVNFNSRTSCEVRPRCDDDVRALQISTHAPLARCDVHVGHLVDHCANISTHAPLARCDRLTPILPHLPVFQLTHLLRGATGTVRFPPGRGYFNSRTSCEVRLRRGELAGLQWDFNSRTSCEVRRGHQPGGSHLRHFNSRTSCEVRPSVLGLLVRGYPFQLTHLLRGATQPSLKNRGYP